MKAPKNIEDQLREKMPPIRNKFRTALRAQLYQKAEQKFQRSSSFIPIFTLLFKNMKRYSFAYLSILVIGVFSLTTFLKTPLTAQEVLANALENYEEVGEIYHEKVESYDYQDNKLISSGIYETYSDENGNFLSLIKDIDTEAITSVHLEVKDSLGVIDMYNNPENVMDISSEISEEPTESNYQDKWLETFRGDKIYCVKNVDIGPGLGKAFLMLAADDYSVYQVGGAGPDSPMDETSEEADINKMLSLSSSENKKESIKKYIQTLAEEDKYNYSFITEGKNTYYLFNLQEGPEEIGFKYSFYIDAKTFDLARYEVASQGSLQKYVTLKTEYLNAADYSDLFDPNRFDNLVGAVALEADPVRNFMEDGCYDPQMNKMEDSILEKFPKKAFQEWKDLEDSMAVSNHPLEIVNLIDQQHLPFDPKSVQMPTQVAMTQGYHEGHKAWDFAPGDKQDIAVYSPKDGIVKEIAEDGHNGGLGKFILISHQIKGKEMITRYAHLAEIDVEVGQTVKAGDNIGIMGQTGFVTGMSLHFEVIIDGQPVNPALLWQ